LKELAPAVTYPKGKSLTQGTIFSCSAVEGYDGCRAWGLIITAKCDVANDKVRTYNYVPVVSLDDWLHRDGRVVLAERLLADTFSSMKSILKDSGFSYGILDTEVPKTILERLFPGGSNGPKTTAGSRFKQLCDRYDLAQVGRGGRPNEAVSLEIAKVAPKLKDALIRELVHQKLSGYYFLSRIEPDSDDIGHVVLVREIQAAPRDLAHAIGAGLDFHQYAEICKDNPRLMHFLQIDRDDMAMPVGAICSPNLEHLMQCFSALFIRIGLVDPDPSYVAQLWERQPSVAEAQK
jgi:hypothetical protein